MCLINKFHIRHNNKEGTKAQDYIVSLDDSKLEEWYDNTYDVLLQAIITNENIRVEQEIDNLKQTYPWKN
ncbi:MAG: hypothetical protein IJ300_13210 [Clostridia bacterium]|nr:hypothetical protein [Clostridia bacterium]